ncbi:hypothetical protein CBS101457_005369 [Exobasidium rhododendri]|nr:hypothetical protein CBS101457_005369 [Exobasidium rhododendri]
MGIVLSITIVQYLATAVFFGILHQGGMIPAMLDVNDQLRSRTLARNADPIQLTFWRSFMPPRHLITPIGKSGESVLVHDRQSMSVEDMARTLVPSHTDSQHLLFGPAWALNNDVKTYLRNLGLHLTPLTRPYLHLDTDHLGESISEYRGGRGLFESFSYAAWSVDHVDTES